MKSNKKINVVIVVDNGSRDLLSCRLLQEEFKKQGFEVYLTDKRLMRINLRKYQPDAVVLPRGDLPYLKGLAKCSRLYVVPCEGGRLTLKTMLSVFLGRVHKGGDFLSKNEKRLDHSSNEITNFDFIRRVYFWGPLAYNFVSETDYFKPEQLKITGCVKLDVYRKKREVKKVDPKNFTLGVAFSAKSASCFFGKIPYAEVLYGYDDQTHLPMVPEGRHWEDYAWRDFGILRRMMCIIKRFLTTSEGKVLLRVGPLEDPGDYEFLLKKHPGRIEIQEDKGEIYEFLENIDVMLTCWSTIGVEAAIFDVPVIAIPHLLDYDFLLQHINPQANGFSTFLPCYHLPKSEDEVLEYVERARNGQLNPTPDPASKTKLLNSLYNWSLEESAAERIVKDVKEDFATTQYEVVDTWKNAMPLPRVVELLAKVLSVFGRKNAFTCIRILYQIKFFIEDVFHKRIKGSRRHHMTKSPHVEAVIEKCQKLTVNTELLKELEDEARHPEAVH